MVQETHNSIVARGGRVRLYAPLSNAKDELGELMREIVWGSELPAEDKALVKKKLAEAGIDFDAELAKRGRETPPKGESIKTDYGDLAELIGYYIETKIDGAPVEYVWAKNITSKTVSRISLPGLDGVSVHLGDYSASEPLQDGEWLKIIEWKHTEDPTIEVPTRRSAEFLLGLTMPRFLQELKIISKDLSSRGQNNRSVRT